MKINWKVRIKNPLWWVQAAGALVLPVLAYFGLAWEDMTSWGALWDVFLRAVQNPVVLLAAAVSVFNAVTDPTTALRLFYRFMARAIRVRGPLPL